MGEIIIKGPEALEFLNYVLTNDLNKISDSQAIYSLMYEMAELLMILSYIAFLQMNFSCVNASNTEYDFYT